MSQRLRGAWRAGGVGLAAIVLVVACAGGRAGFEPNDDADGRNDLADGEATSESDGSEGGDDFEEPTPEDTTEEAPAEVVIDPTTIEVATLPIGGNPDDAGGNLQCVDVGWSDPPEIPAGVTVVIEGLALEPAGDFALSDQPCPGDAPLCLPDHAVTPVQRCTVAVEWTETAGNAGGWLDASGTIVCNADADICSGFADAVAERGGQSIELLPPPTGNGEDEGGSGSSDEGGEHGEDSEQNGVEGPPEDEHGDAEEDGEQNGAEGNTENGDG